ncbi:Detected protein of confused Function [Hibiscus syriacus]|uniref:Detected protein of confused Function n=1 Tax=Hibiscus syriacus TaxID=106335 RepID=A0A6A2YIF5_HIBSY|nr:Detected protein of confused Function [Hibiscus syriacus]
MVKGGKVGCRNNFRRRGRSKDEDSDEGFGGFLDEEEKVVRKAVRSKAKKMPPVRKRKVVERNHLSGKVYQMKKKMKIMRSMKKKKKKSTRRRRRRRRKKKNMGWRRRRRKKKSMRWRRKGEEEEVEEEEEYDDEDDDEFTLDKEDCFDEEEELIVEKKKNNMKVLRKGCGKRERAVEEASRLCRSLKTNLRSSSSSKIMEEVEELGQHQKPPGRKGKEKVEEKKAEVLKTVCGICLSEEDKRRFRGTLNCCSHYFCFTCIMAWSKVESRCPLCKQRFETITHTYCVGLGREVPEGNWYCDGCRPVALGSSISQVQDSLPDQRTNNLFPSVDVTAGSPVSGVGAPTLTGRRWLHRQIQNLRSINRTNLMAGKQFQDSSAASFGTPVNLTLWPELACMSSNEQLRHCSNESNIRPDGCDLPFSVRGEDNFDGQGTVACNG